MKHRPLRIGLLGHGAVGSETARALTARRGELAARIGASIELVGIAVRTPRPGRDTDPDLFTTDAEQLVTRGDLDVVVELMGGIEPARSLIVAAMESGASVVTANKALIADDGADLHRIAHKHGVELAYEAAVAGAVPLLRPLRQSLAGDRVRRLSGVVNGTTNFILDRMAAIGGTFQAALNEAQQLGYAEADPTADVSGADAAAKMTILARLAFDTDLGPGDVHYEGITHIGPADISHAAANDSVIKLIGICDRTADGVSVRVHPMLLPRDHALAGVRGSYNGILVEAEAAGQLMFHGQGAGGLATSSAVLGDLVEVCRNRLTGAVGAHQPPAQLLPVRTMDQVATRHQLSLLVTDRPGVLSEVTAAFGHHGVSLATVRQEGLGSEAQLVVSTHLATDAALAAVVTELNTFESVRGITRSIRMMGRESDR
ncbi:homoserine dehydrogenase [Streptomyces sp. ISL-96]|uniref:homoserine dehydrogenase n=1 Tax=Streptomyces sp. ISL-96 TaxID=2819191 RepID=UPI001BE737B8|nr:homoserine dehydrogenase [Streptomyces sp. ISL-96]MBT2493599.1 homoserine dehydrogenase [Streptomyces sp. ISL-96]